MANLAFLVKSEETTIRKMVAGRVVAVAFVRREPCGRYSLGGVRMFAGRCYDRDYNRLAVDRYGAKGESLVWTELLSVRFDSYALAVARAKELLAGVTGR